ncbi:MAG TPA: hypothetical protein DCP63_09610 [Bacteroidetes bacterium]|nr:hypothetical protein [Bacteroidota bacterium]
MNTLRNLIPHPGYLNRIRIYLKEMYPVPKRLISAVLMYLSFTELLRQNYGVRSPLISLSSFVGIASVFSFLLILRLMDELKDKEVDLALFCDRPLPSGRVQESDIRFSLVLVVMFFVAINSLCGSALGMGLVVLGYAFLMFKYFFIPELLSKHLVLNLISHNPIVPLVFLYLVVSFAQEHHLDVRSMNWRVNISLIVMYWSMSFAWEIARKIRSDVEENAYVTYSRLFGKRGAVAIAAIAQTLTLAFGLLFASLNSLSLAFTTVCVAGYAAVMWGHLRFVLNPNPRTSQLRPWAEQFMLSVAAAGCIEALVL